ncbi:hypothetical protein KAR91_50885 [Candidatus Pacearchaeota archaeon]|nr:hypothetical protein [Candidatus Pacearchaeota archaeon]
MAEMEIATEFQSNLITLRFESSGRQIKLDREETKEFNRRMQTAIDEQR